MRILNNSGGTLTTLGGSLMPSEALEAMYAAASACVDLADFLVKSGEFLVRRIAVAKRTLAVVFFLGSQIREQLTEMVIGATERGVLVMVDDDAL